MPLLRSRRSKIIVAIALVCIILVGGVFGYLTLLITNLNKAASNPALPSPSITGYLNYQGLLAYNNGQYEFPYVSVVYNAVSAGKLNAKASIFVNKPPSHLYILNFTGGCYQCGNATEAINSLISGINGYGMNWLVANTSYISPDNLSQVQNDSILVIVTGLLPSQLEDNNFSIMSSLLQRQTSILYVGLNFSSMIIPGVVPTQAPTSGVPKYLQTSTEYSRGNGGIFTFNSPTFRFSNGSRYYFATYTNVGNGSIVSFPNTLQSWPTEQEAGADMATAIWQMFWLPRYASGSTTGAYVSNGGSGAIGIPMNKTPIPYNLTLPGVLNRGYMVVVVGAAPLYAGKRTAYMYITGQPKLGSRGIVSIAPTLAPNTSGVQIGFNITSKPARPVNLSTYIEIYNQNLTSVLSVPGPSIHNFSSKSPTLIVHQNLDIGPGRYIVMLRNFSDNTEVAGGFFTIPSYVITPVNVNFTAGIYIFRIKSGGEPVSNIRYNISLDNAYPSSGVMQSGVIEYKLPAGTPQPSGPLNFTFTILGQKIGYRITHETSPFLVNSEYVEVGVVILMMIIMVVFVRAPTRDEFYVDVPNLPESKKVDIKLKAADVLSVFDKLNANYHWKYMPLSKTEMKSAIAINIKYNNIPVELTYSNVDSILDSLLVKNMVVSEDELYAPIAWMEASKHDITYLATFKKLRIYFVTHSYTFTDIDTSEEADLVATIHGTKKYVVIYSDTSRFKNIPMYPGSRTYLVFVNSDAMEDFRAKLYETSSAEAEKLKMYISADYIRLVDGNEIEKTIG
jgi:hypothetical protein